MSDNNKYREIEIYKDKIIFDPSVLYFLLKYNLLEYNIFSELGKIEIFIPNSLYELINKSKENEEYRNILLNFIYFFSYESYREINKKEIDRLYENLNKLNIRIISDKDIDNKFYEKIYNLLPNSYKFKNIKLFGRKINLLKDTLAKIICFSVQKTVAILQKTRKFINLIRERINLIELSREIKNVPGGFKELKKLKENLFSPVTTFTGVKEIKWFIGIFAAFFGCIEQVPFNQIIDIADLVFIFMDP